MDIAISAGSVDSVKFQESSDDGVADAFSDIPDQEKVDEFLPPYEPEYKIDPDNPHAFGGLTDYDGYLELRYIIQKAIEDAIP